MLTLPPVPAEPALLPVVEDANDPVDRSVFPPPRKLPVLLPVMLLPPSRVVRVPPPPELEVGDAAEFVVAREFDEREEERLPLMAPTWYSWLARSSSLMPLLESVPSSEAAAPFFVLLPRLRPRLLLEVFTEAESSVEPELPELVMEPLDRVTWAATIGAVCVRIEGGETRWRRVSWVRRQAGKRVFGRTHERPIFPLFPRIVKETRKKASPIRTMYAPANVITQWPWLEGSTMKLPM